MPAQLALDPAASGGAAPSTEGGAAADAGAPPDGSGGAGGATDPELPEHPDWWLLREEWQRRKGVVGVAEWRKFVGPLCEPGPGGEPPYPLPLLCRAVEVAAARVRGTQRAAFLTPRSFAADIVDHVRYARMPMEELLPHLPIPPASGTGAASANGPRANGPRANGSRPEYASA